MGRQALLVPGSWLPHKLGAPCLPEQRGDCSHPAQELPSPSRDLLTPNPAVPGSLDSARELALYTCGPNTRATRQDRTGLGCQVYPELLKRTCDCQGVGASCPG